jgi:hypothetical protein
MDVRALFGLIDTDRDGRISPDELTVHCLSTGMDPEDVTALFSRLDINNDGFISVEEFAAGVGVELSLSPTATFDVRGICLHVVSYIAQRGRDYGALRRVCLEDGSTAIVLGSAADTYAVQRRALANGGTVIERTDATIPHGAVVGEDLVAALGERVVLSASLQKRAALVASTVGTVVGYNRQTAAYKVAICQDEGAQREVTPRRNWSVLIEKIHTSAEGGEREREGEGEGEHFPPPSPAPRLGTQPLPRAAGESPAARRHRHGRDAGGRACG